VLAYLVEHETSAISLHDRLGKLQEREFIRLRAELEYIFKHAVTQDVAYNSLLIGRRKALHRVTAEAIETLFPNHLDELAATIAYHYQQAEVVDKALDYLTRAADTAKATYANSEAINFYNAALEQAAQLPAGERQSQLTAELYENLADVFMLTGQNEEAHTAYEKALVQVEIRDTVAQARLYGKMAKTRDGQRRYDDALDYLKAAEALLTSNLENASSEAQSEWVEIQLLRMRMYYWLNQQALSNSVTETLQPVVDRYGTPVQRATFFTSVALAHLRQERYLPSPEALRYAHAGAAANQELDNLADAAWNQFAFGFLLLWNHQLDEAEKELQSALKVTERTGDVILQSRCLTYLTVVCRKQCQIDRVREYADRSLIAANAGNMIEYVGMAHGNLAWADVREGHTALGRENSSHGLHLMSKTAQSSMFPWVCQCPLIEAYLIENQLAEAIETSRAAITHEGQPLPDEMTSLIEKALLAWEGGDTEATRNLLEQAVRFGKSDGYM
jgi:eukaryotic-like serine/threonine-protein kinase